MTDGGYGQETGGPGDNWRTMRRLYGLSAEDNDHNSVAKPSDTPHVVYRLMSEKNRQSLRKSSSAAADTTPTTATKTRYLVSQKTGKVYQIVHKNGVQQIQTPVVRELREPESDLISDDQFFKYLGLIDNKSLETQTKCALNLWPLREISKVKNKLKTNPNGDLILTNIASNGSSNTSEETEKTEVSRRTAAKQQWLDEVRDNTQNHLQRFQDQMSDNGSLYLSKDSMNLLSGFELSSFMGKRVFRSLSKPLNDLQKYMKIIRFENYCVCQMAPKMSLSANNASGYMPRISRHGSDWSSRHNHHSYCFTRRQRLEKWCRLETGLDWRSRLMKSQCRRLRVKLKRLISCPICTETVDFSPRHQCWQMNAHLRPQPLSRPQPLPHQITYSCRPKDSSDEIIIIGDDFMDMNEMMDSCDSFGYNLDTKEEVIKANDEEDDDVVIIEEVVKPKAVNSILKMSLSQQIAPKECPILSSQLSSCNPLIRALNDSISVSIVSNSYSNQNDSNETNFVYNSHH